MSMKKSASAVSVIGGADGPTSVFVLKKDAKLTLRQKMGRLKTGQSGFMWRKRSNVKATAWMK